MLRKPSEAVTLSKVYNIPPEDILFLDFSLSGINVDLPYARVRFEFTPEDRTYFSTSIEKDIDKYFFALPITPNSSYNIKDDYLIMEGEILGKVSEVANDTCDLSYPRRDGTVLNLNPTSKSLCHGCKFCHTIQQVANDRDNNLHAEPALRKFIEVWLEKYKVSDLSHLIQAAIVTGCFGDEQKVLEYLKMAKKVLNGHNFKGEIFYFGSEITTKKSLEELKKIKPFGLCLSLECFKNRKMMLRNIKARLSLEDIKKILSQSVKNGFRTNFSYILGMESLDIIQEGFRELFPYINSFPVINIFQIHQGQEKLRHPEAWNFSYYMKARKMLEKMFKDTNMRPRVWENYRSLWYLNFATEELNDIRTP